MPPASGRGQHLTPPRLAQGPELHELRAAAAMPAARLAWWQKGHDDISTEEIVKYSFRNDHTDRIKGGQEQERGKRSAAPVRSTELDNITLK